MDHKIENKEEKFRFWILIFIMLILVSLMLIILLSPSSAFEWKFGQAKYCQFMELNSSNQTECDQAYCIDVLTNSTQICKLNDGKFFIYQNISLNLTNISTINNTDVLSLIRNETKAVKDECSKYAENLTASQKETFVKKMDEISEDVDEKIGAIDYTPTEQTPFWLIGLIVIVIGAVVIFLAWKKFQPRAPPVINPRQGIPLTRADPNDYYGDEDKEEDNEFIENHGETEEVQPKKK